MFPAFVTEDDIVIASRGNSSVVDATWFAIARSGVSAPTVNITLDVLFVSSDSKINPSVSTEQMM